MSRIIALRSSPMFGSSSTMRKSRRSRGGVMGLARGAAEGRGARGRALGGQRQREGEAAPRAHRALGAELCAMVLDDLVGDGQSEPHALALLGEEQLGALCLGEDF